MYGYIHIYLVGFMCYLHSYPSTISIKHNWCNNTLVNVKQIAKAMKSCHVDNTQPKGTHSSSFGVDWYSIYSWCIWRAEETL